MKKTLIALAALAATGASFAQVTITGNLTAGYQQSVSNVYGGGTFVSGTRTVVQNTTSGFGVDTAEISFNAKEDLGGGQVVEANLGIENVVRGAAPSTATPVSTGFSPSNAVLTYTNTSFGRIQLGTTRGAAAMSGTAKAGAPTIDFDDKLFERRTNGDFISFTTKLGPVAVGLNYSESSASVGLGSGTSGFASGGSDAAPTGTRQRNNTLFAAYNDSGLKLEGFYRGYDNIDTQNLQAVFGGISKTDAMGFNLGYDFGVVNTGFGYANINASAGPKVEWMLAGASMPLGALTLGVTYGSSKLSGVGDTANSKFDTVAGAPGFGGAVKPIFAVADGTATGWSVGASYALSKRTSFIANYAAWTRAGYEQAEAYFDAPRDARKIGYGPIETQANLLLSHSF